MGIFEQFPYTNFHNLNLDWILKTMQDLYTRTITWMEQNNIQFSDPIEWDPQTVYSPNRIVWDSGTETAYISKSIVPAGTLISDRKFWLPVAAIEIWPQYTIETETATFRGSLTTASGAKTTTHTYMVDTMSIK